MAKGSMIKYLPLMLFGGLINPFRTGAKSNNKGLARMMPVMSGNPIFIPRRKKLKGWQKELKRKKHYNKFR